MIHRISEKIHAVLASIPCTLSRRFQLVYEVQVEHSPLDGQAIAGLRQHARIRSLVSSAAHVVGARGSVLVLNTGQRFEIIASSGESGENFRASDELLHELLALDIYIHRSFPTSIKSSFREACPGLTLLASVPVALEGENVGLLAVLNPHPRTLSGAQEYVLRTLAAEIGDQLELEQLRHEKAENITVRSTIDERLRLLESVVVNANDAVLITEAEPVDLPGPRIIYANAAFTRTTGYTLEEILGQTPRILQGPETGTAARERLKEALRKWDPVEVELLNYRKDGSSFWVELSIVPVADETGWYTHWVSVQRDVSERKVTEENAIRFRLAQEHNQALAEEVKERMRAEAELAHTAFHDHLTGLRNRAYFMDRLGTSTEQAGSRPEYRCAVIFLDLDNFKFVNDSLGHSVGDLMLAEIANRLRACSRPQDTIARMGGDEFTLLLDDIGGDQEAASIAERILRALASPIHLAGSEVIASASIGVSIGSYSDPEQILRDADTAMYRAKQDGGGRYAIFSEEMHEKAIAALHVRLELRAAIEKDQFELHYQPIVDTETRKICGVEALVRWRHPQRGMLPPLDFIGVAEETGLIVPLGSWVLHEACRHLAHWRTILPGDGSFKVSVNVSSRQLEDANFYTDLHQALDEHGVDAQALELEITESVFMQKSERIGTLFNSIRALGVRIAFDDFGTGYSSLSYLERYPIDTLKIDQSFVRSLMIGPANADIVRMIIGLARALSVEVTAEGVETILQRDALEMYGCSRMQGYFYSRPVPFLEMTSLLAKADALFEQSPEASPIGLSVKAWSV